MVNSAGVYLSAEEQTVFLCDISWDTVPIGIAIESFRKRMDWLCLQQGQSFTFRENILCFPGGVLHLSPLKTPAAEYFDPEPKTQCIQQAAQDIADLQKPHGISMLAVPLILDRDEPSLLLLNPYCARAYPLLHQLMHALCANAEADVSRCVASLLGLGTGLTPSADDVILGMLFVFRQMPQRSPKSVGVFRESVAALCDTHTNRISASYLKAILRGERFFRMEQVWRGLCGESPLETTALTQIGSNSGCEMLLGMLIALSVCGYMPDFSL